MIPMSLDYDEINPLRDLSHLFDRACRVGVIVGGAGGMGTEFARTLAGAGATVIIADATADRTEAATERLADLRLPGRIVGRVCDVSREAQIEALFSSVPSDFGRLDFLVYNVMAKPEGYYRSTEQYELETWNAVVNGNMTGAFLCCRQAAVRMKSLGSGAIVLTASVYGVVGLDQRVYEGCTPVGNIYGGGDVLNCPAAYSASKAGLMGTARYFSTLWAHHGIRVNVLVPGGVYDGQEPPFHDAYIQRTPIGRMAVWSDFNGAVLFLVSDASRYMTGAQLVIDGGWTAW